MVQSKTYEICGDSLRHRETRGSNRVLRSKMLGELEVAPMRHHVSSEVQYHPPIVYLAQIRRHFQEHEDHCHVPYERARAEYGSPNSSPLQYRYTSIHPNHPAVPSVRCPILLRLGVLLSSRGQTE